MFIVVSGYCGMMFICWYFNVMLMVYIYVIFSFVYLVIIEVLLFVYILISGELSFILGLCFFFFDIFVYEGIMNIFYWCVNFI